MPEQLRAPPPHPGRPQKTSPVLQAHILCRLAHLPEGHGNRDDPYNEPGAFTGRNPSSGLEPGLTGPSTQVRPCPNARPMNQRIHEQSSQDGAGLKKIMSPMEIEAMAWEEAERAKYTARFKRDEVKIQAWENHQKRKGELENRKVEVKAERLKSRAHEKYNNKLAASRRIADEKLANAEAELQEKAIKTSEKADYIRRYGYLPSFFSFKLLPSFCW
ncbi:Remorin family protein [Striga hermonthica]|uniref:Remorin family protein n=1 Tax=Striga hermonthica TaxID=68872 RepID=A0A9N7NF86_STRHE|nr:Remorin family protein [Striga hermonthica]